MTATHQHLTTIAEFMGWNIKRTKVGELFFDEEMRYIYPHYFDTMRMVFDKWREVVSFLKSNPVHAFEIRTHEQHFSIYITSGTPSDCAARLHEAIEWWKTVKN